MTSSLDNLKNLISQLKQLQSKDIVPVPFRFIPNLRLCISVLEEIDGVVGVEDFKSIILSKFKSFVVNYVRVGNPLGKTSLHTLIYAKPGMGKTHIGKLLAKFWTVTGCLNKTDELHLTTSRPLERNFLPQRDQLLSALTAVNQLRKRVVSKKEEQNPIIQAKFQELKSKLRLIYKELDQRKEVLPILVPSNPSVRHDSHLEANLKFGIFTRADFVGPFQGHSVEKTKEIFKKYKGGVIMIDEAYSLMTSDSDAFGREVLTEINNHMSLHPDEIVFIFAGYKEQINDLFKLQVGLARRFNWTIEIKDYSAQDLLQILIQQLEPHALKMTPEACTLLLEILTSEKASFPHYGGDTYILSNQIADTVNEELWLRIFSGQEISKESQEITVNALTLSLAKYKNYKPKATTDQDYLVTMYS